MKMGYYKDGFTLDGPVQQSGLIKMKAATVEILKGQAIFNDGSGYATNATTAFSNAFLGIAAHDLDNNPAVTGAEIAIIPALPDYRFWVKVEADALIAQEDIGLTVDLEANDSIDINDTTTLVVGFRIYDMDVSADAVAINTYGYAYGAFVHNADES